MGGCMSSGIHNPLPFEGQDSTSIISLFLTSIVNIILLEYYNDTSQQYYPDILMHGPWEDCGCFPSLYLLGNTSL